MRGHLIKDQSPQHILLVQRPWHSKLKYGTRVGKLHKRQTTPHIHVPSRRWQTVLGANLLQGGVVQFPQDLMGMSSPQFGSPGPTEPQRKGTRLSFFPFVHTEGFPPPRGQKLLTQEEAAWTSW
jgi:hypothetical protein